MKKFLLSLLVLSGLSVYADDYKALELYVWNNDNQKGYDFVLNTTDGDVYTGTGFTVEGGTNLAGIQVVTTDWETVYGCPAGEWYELKTDGTPVNLVLGGPNGCWMWDATIAETDHVWFCVSKLQLIVNQSATSPWGGGSDVTGIDEIMVDNEPAVYYNLQGIQVATPETGKLYIKKQGSKTVKVVY